MAKRLAESIPNSHSHCPCSRPHYRAQTCAAGRPQYTVLFDLDAAPVAGDTGVKRLEYKYKATPCISHYWEALRSSVGQQIPRLLWNLKFQGRVHERKPVLPLLNVLNTVHTTTPYFFKIHLNNTLPHTSVSPQ